MPAVKGKTHAYMTLQNGKDNLSVKSIARNEKSTAGDEDFLDLDSTSEVKEAG